MLNLKFLFTAIVTVILFNACTKDDLPIEASEQPLKKIVNKWYDSVGEKSFNYDLDGKLSIIETSNSQTHMWRTFLYYNNQKKVVKAVRMHYYGSLNNLLSQNTDSFVYDVSNRIISRLTLSGQTASYRTTNIYSYDAQNRLLVDSNYSSLTSRVEEFQKFNYDGNDNIVQKETFKNNLGTFYSEGVTKISYNSYQNPYYSLGVAVYLIDHSDDFTMLSKNAPQQIVYRPNYTTDFSYELYSNGQPKKTTEAYKEPNSSSITTTEFFY